MTQSLNEIKIEVKGESLYASHEKIYPRQVDGRFHRVRSLMVYLLLGVYYFTPWLQWGDRQAVLFDLPARKFHIFFFTFWPQDFIFLALLLIMSGLALFFFTAMAGRVFCGFACPQTVWTEAFIRIERWVEGSRAQQIKLSNSPWNANKIRKRITKQVLWIGLAIITGLSFVGYFEPIRELVPAFFSLELGGWALFWVLFYGFATYGNAGFMREQVCKYMCPYARFQSAMFDNDTLIVAYDEKRGEPRSRGKKRKDDESGATGDCIDCGICVQVCPTGIDIRDGLQYECIACAACIDACDVVMEKVGLPQGLIKYSTQSQDEGSGKSLKQTLMRPRTLVYGTLLGLVFVGFAVALGMRSSFQVDVLRDRNALYRWSINEEIENVYQIKVMNKGQNEQQYQISVSGLPGARIAWSKGVSDSVSRVVGAGEIGDFSAVVTLSPEEKYRTSQTIELTVQEVQASAQTVKEKTRFWGPAKRPTTNKATTLQR